jgi:hypothetical protein
MPVNCGHCNRVIPGGSMPITSRQDNETRVCGLCIAMERYYYYRIKFVGSGNFKTFSQMGIDKFKKIEDVEFARYIREYSLRPEYKEYTVKIDRRTQLDLEWVIENYCQGEFESVTITKLIQHSVSIGLERYRKQREKVMAENGGPGA